MRIKIILGLLFVLAICFLGAQTKQTNPFEGNWELISNTGQYLDDNGVLSNASFKKNANNFHMKMIHDNYFMFAGQEIVSGKANASYGYGTYTHKDDVYTETVIYHMVKSMIGKSVSFEVTVKGDTLIQKGPLKIGEYKDAKWEFTETYVRR